MSNNQYEIPQSFTASVERPFEPIGVRTLVSQLYDRNNQRLTDAQVAEMQINPQPTINPNARLEKFNEEANAQLAAESENQKVYNLSYRDVAARTTSTVHDILDDLVKFNPADGIRGFLHIFIQSDRLVYVGIIIIIVTLAIMLFRSSDSTPSIAANSGGGCCCRNH
jgi:hypothetical protein